MQAEASRRARAAPGQGGERRQGAEGTGPPPEPPRPHAGIVHDIRVEGDTPLEPTVFSTVQR